ncbi:MAG TPA: diguanylate cyclase [Sulfuricurvum sp.]|nr:diguanylate cyclase [Sulfuricurvum sp.]
MLKKRHTLLVLLGILFLPALLFSNPLEKVTLQLRWFHQFQFAGYYMAKEKGYYKEAGLDVTLLEADKKHPYPVEEVISGRAQYGVGNSGLINERSNGKPIVVLAAIFQSSPNVWIARKDSGIVTVVDLAHKRLMMTKNIENAELLALFRNEGLHYNQLNIIDSTFDINDLINGKVDAFNGYSTNEPYYLKEKGVEYVTIDPRKYGVDFYSDCLFTSDKELSDHPERVKAFREASLKGWTDAMNNPEEAIDLILKHYSQAKTREHLRFEADAIHMLMEPELIEIGHMNPARWIYIAKTYHELEFSPSDTVPEGFIYTPNGQHNDVWLHYILAAACILILIIGSITWYIYRLNCKIKKQALHDSLTGLYNRYYLDETLPREMARAVRESYPIALVLIDLDHFKSINDTYGHAAGDEVLKKVAQSLTSSIRQNDFACRFGGEEFIIVMPGMPADQAIKRVEACRLMIETTPISYNDQIINVTISAGVSIFPDHGITQDSLLKSADDALYCSKESGRNQTTLFTTKDA